MRSSAASQVGGVCCARDYGRGCRWGVSLSRVLVGSGLRALWVIFGMTGSGDLVEPMRESGKPDSLRQH